MSYKYRKTNSGPRGITKYKMRLPVSRAFMQEAGRRYVPARRWNPQRRLITRGVMPSLVEKKWIDETKAAGDVSQNTWARVDPAGNGLCQCVQGVTENQRDGTKIIVKSIEICGEVYRDQTHDQADMRDGNSVQVSLVMDTQTNGAALVANNVYVDTGQVVPGRRVVAGASRYKILRSQTFQLQDVSSGTDGANTNSLGGMRCVFKWFVTMQQVMNFVGGAGAGNIADCKDYSFHMLVGSTSVTAGDHISYTARTRFVG